MADARLSGVQTFIVGLGLVLDHSTNTNESRTDKIMNYYIAQIKCYALIMVTLISSGCTPVALNTGATDYARADNTEAPIYVDSRYESLKRKYGETSNVDKLIVNKGESISVTLQHVFIKDFSERLERITSKFSFDAVRGEIAILAKVYEQTDGTHIDHTTSGIKKSGRLIYYSEDVRSGGHPLNFSQLPIYGPIEYKGNSLVVQLTILELDAAESNQLKGILSALAAMGKKAYAPASPVLEVLDSVANNLLSGEQDDQELNYSFTLHPNSGHTDVKDAKLMVGNYILIKEEPIKRPIGTPFDKVNWDDFRFNSDEGYLEHTKLEKNGINVWQDFTDKSYIVIQIETGLPSVGLDVAQAFSELESDLAKEVDNTDFVSKLTGTVDEFRIYSSEQHQKEEMKKLFAQAMIHLTEYSGSSDANVKKQALAAYFDIVVGKNGFPAALPSPVAAPKFEQYQWKKMLAMLRNIATDPFKVSQASVSGSSNYAALELLLK